VRAGDVLAVLDCLGAAGVSVWLDGGWGVDAPVGRQTRPHDDVDVVLPLDETDRAIGALAGRGFAVDQDLRPTRLVLRDGERRQVDVHPVVFDRTGTGWQRGAAPDGGDCRYPAEGFVAGVIAGRPVGCLSAAVQLAHHTGYPPDAKDRHDARLLHERFGLRLPPGLE
jgi:lincosamide nucleotidyltransferase A/C/D/E